MVSTNDGLQNAITGQGGAADSRSSNMFVRTPQNDNQIEAAYVSSPLLAKCIEAPVGDMLRKWRVWDVEKDQAEIITAAEKEFDLRDKVLEARTLADLWGGAVIVVVGGGDLGSEVLPERMGAGGLTALHVLDSRSVDVPELNPDINSPLFNEPVVYDYDGVLIHPSRVVRFDGKKDPKLSSGQFNWGLSKASRIMDCVQDFTSAANNMASLVAEAKVDVFGIPNLLEKVGTKGYEERVIKRLQIANMGKGIHNAVVRDSLETFDQRTFNFSGLPGVVQELLTHVAAAADIPITRLLGQSPGGLNSTGDGDLSNYYDMISTAQENDLRPKLDMIDAFLLRSAGISEPETLKWSWNPLKQMSEKEGAELTKQNAESFRIYADSQTLSDDALGAIAQNMMNDSATFVGAQQAFDDHPDDDGGDLDDPIEEGLEDDPVASS